MREIKFRVWNGKQIVTPDYANEEDDFYVSAEGEVKHLEQVGWDNLTRPAYRKDWVLMQYTGLKDRHGVEIYEGDTVVVPDAYPFYDEGSINYIGTVEWIYSQWQIVLRCVNPKKVGISDGMNYGLNDEGYDEGTNTTLEIIGNRYVNESDFYPAAPDSNSDQSGGEIVNEQTASMA